MSETPPTESTLEARIHGALAQAFPWLPEGAIEHQTSFSVRVGTKPRTVSADKEDEHQRGRVDVLLKWRNQPLAIMELKKPGGALEAEDEEQGLSYARLVTPQAPLVVVTNGEECRWLETHTGSEWSPEEWSEKALATLVKRASQVATEARKTAVLTLMGTEPRIWVEAIRETTASVLAELSGAWEQSLRPFVAGFVIPRRATAEVAQRLRDGSRLVLVEGPPLAGKTSVLRELCLAAGEGDVVALFVEAGAGRGIYERVGDILGRALGWPVRGEEARDWMLNLSRSGAPQLLLCVDGALTPGGAIVAEVADLSSNLFGAGLRVVVALDEAVADQVVLDGRRQSSIGRRATRVSVEGLDQFEFALAQKALQGFRAVIMDGGRYASEYRAPWVLRGGDVKSGARTGVPQRQTGGVDRADLGVGAAVART